MGGDAAVRSPLAAPVAAAAVFFFVCCCCCCCWSQVCLAQTPIPARYDGFVYEGAGTPPRVESIVVEAFFDPLCPDSRDAWPPLKRALHHYSPRVFLIVHPFPLPYHDNAFFSCRALHIANKLNASTAYPLLELFFKNQGKYYNWPTRKLSRESIIQRMSELTAEVTGNLLDIKSGFQDPKTDRAARNSFNYGSSRGVTGTPFFFINGFPLPGSGSALDDNQWKSTIDPLLLKQREMGEDAMFSFS